MGQEAKQRGATLVILWQQPAIIMRQLQGRTAQRESRRWTEVSRYTAQVTTLGHAHGYRLPGARISGRLVVQDVVAREGFALMRAARPSLDWLFAQRTLIGA